jgi:DNA-binding transcriptional regulator YiaG
MTPADLKSARKSLGLSAQQFADLVGVTRDAVCKWEAGHRQIPKMLDLVIELLQMPSVRKLFSDIKSNSKSFDTYFL